MVRGIKSGTKQIADYINLNKLSTKVDRYPYKSVIWANKFQYIHTHNFMSTGDVKILFVLGY